MLFPFDKYLFVWLKAIYQTERAKYPILTHKQNDKLKNITVAVDYINTKLKILSYVLYLDSLQILKQILQKEAFLGRKVTAISRISYVSSFCVLSTE